MIREKLKKQEKIDSISLKTSQKKEDSIESGYLVDEGDKVGGFNNDFLAEINKSKDLSDLKKKLLEETDQNYILKKFSDKFNKTKNNLSNINKMLGQGHSNYILEKLINNFVINNKAILKNFDNNLYTTDYIKTNVLNISDPKLLVADIIKIYLTKQETRVSNLQNFDSKLKEWLVDIVNNKNNKKLEDNKKNFDISYLGFDYNFWAKMRRFKNQKELIEKNRQLELGELDRKYGSDFKKRDDKLSKNSKNFLKLESKIEQELEDKDLKLNFNGCRYFEDKIYRSVNVFYNQKYNKINQQQKQVVDEYRLDLAKINNCQRQREIKNYIKNIVREEYKIDLILDLNLNKNKDHKIFETDHILKFVANKTREFVFDLSDNNKNLFNRSNFSFINNDLKNSGNKNLSNNFLKTQDVVKLKFEPKDQKLDDKNMK